MVFLDFFFLSELAANISAIFVLITARSAGSFPSVVAEFEVNLIAVFMGFLGFWFDELIKEFEVADMDELEAGVKEQSYELALFHHGDYSLFFAPSAHWTH